MRTPRLPVRHGGAKVLISDREFSPVIEGALALLDDQPLVIDIDDPAYPHGKLFGETDYKSFLQEGDPKYSLAAAGDEWDAIALNYTSGTTGDPKGVVTHHRGAHLNAVNNILNWDAAPRGISLDIADVSLQRLVLSLDDRGKRAGANVCLRRVEAKAMLDAIRDTRHSHVRAPIVYGMLINAPGTCARDGSQVRSDRRRRAAHRNHRRG